MKLTYCVLPMVAVTLFVGVAAGASSLTRYNGTIKVTSESFASGQCADSDPHANLCPSGGTCLCETFEGSYSGTAGSGGVGTIDEGYGIATTFAATGCSPMYGVIRITGSKDDETFGFNGAACLDFDNTIFNGGGCVMFASIKFPSGAVAACTAKVNTSTNPPSGKLAIKGLANTTIP